MNVRKTISIVAVVCLAAALALPLAGCQKKDESSSTTTKSVAKPVLPSGHIKKLEVVMQSKLPSQTSADITSWLAAGSVVDSAPMLPAGSYKPLITADHFKLVKMAVGSGTNGIAVENAELSWDAEGTKLLAEATAGAPKDDIVIVIDGKVAAAVAVTEPIDNGALTIEGAKNDTFVFRKHITVPTTTTAQ